MNNNTKSLLVFILSMVGFVLAGCLGWWVRGKVDEPATLEEQEEVVVPQDTLGDWEVLQMAIVMTESKFNPKAVGAAGDWGIFQQVPIYVAECNRILELRKEETRYSHEDSFDIDKSIEMFNLLQSHYNPEKDLDKAIRYQNKAEWYKKRVKENVTFIRQMELVRKQLKEGNRS